MKKIFLVLTLMIFGYGAFSQTIKNSASSANPEVSPAVLNTGNDNASNAPSVSISSKALKNFKKSFKSATDEKWFEMPDGYRVKFTTTGTHSTILYKVDYDKKGNWTHTIRSYDEKELARDIKEQVKMSYLDYTIVWVEEVIMPRQKATHIVHLEGPTDWVNVRISDGEMDEFQRYNK